MSGLQRLPWAALVVGACAQAQQSTPDAAHPAQHVQASGAAARDAMSEGEVRKMDKGQARITLRHGPIASLDMAPMTMVFRVADPKWLDRLKAGDKVRFTAERVNGTISVTAIEPASP